MTPPEKAAICARVDLMTLAGMSLRSACADLGCSPASVLRWRRELAACEGDAFAAFSGKKPTGRPPVVEFSESDLAIARWHRLCKSSLNIAIYFFCRDADASPEAVAALRRIEERALENKVEPSWPISVQRAFRVSLNERANFRGQKAVNDVEMVSRRGMLWIDEEGELQNLLPGELWELDDYSCNQPFTYRDPQTGELEVGRQILAGMDVCGGGWLGFDLIGRPRDAYRGEDIVRFIGRLFRAHGIPRFLRLERGSWESSYVHGLEVEGLTQPWGALDHFCHITHVFKSKGKGLLESSFNPFQNWLAHAGRDVGRYAGEFQESAKAWRQVKNAASRPDPRVAGFWAQDQCAAAHEEAARIMNSRPRTRAGHGERVAADDLIARHGWNTTPLPAEEAWRLLPVKDRRVVNGGMVRVNPGGGWPELTYVVNGQDGLCLENGHAVLIACDPLDPSTAYIANADRSPRNRSGWSVGHPLLAAAPLYNNDAPQIDLSGRRHGSLDLRRRAAAAAATEFRAVTAGAPGRREVAAFDGNGRAATGGTLPPIERPEPGPRVADPRPAGRQGLAPDPLAPVRGDLVAGTPPSASRAPQSPDAAALFGDDRAARLAAMEAEAATHF
jgi:hypothetical protein